MKKHLLILLFPFVSYICANAETFESNDSIIRIFANWQKGDRLLYRYTESEFTTVDNDTISAKESEREDFSLEIMETDTTGYTVKYTLLDHQTIMLNDNKEQVEISTFPIPVGTNILFRTDSTGSLEDILNWDELLEVFNNNPTLFSVSEGVTIDINNIDPTLFTPISMISDKEELLETIPYVRQLFNFHGMELQEGNIYSWDDKYESVWDEELIDVKSELIAGLDEDNTILIYQSNIVNSDQLIDNYINYFSRFMENPEMLKSPERPYIFIEQELIMEIDNLSGYVVSTNYDVRNSMGNETSISSVEVKRIME